MRIDSHHHFWTYSPEQYGWIDDGMAVLKRDFVPADLQSQLAAVGIAGAVSVQARQTVDETRWLLGLAEAHAAVRGVVGWIPLADPNVAAILESFLESPWLRGIRHVVQDEPDDRFILGRDFNRGVSLLKDAGLVYDILVFPRQLSAAIEFVDQHPQQRFVLDHIAKPEIRRGRFDEAWARDFRELARRENVLCKFSGLVTEVRDPEWSTDLLRPYWDVALAAFGPQRLMFGSDWPVCLLRSSYSTWIETVEALASGFSEAEKRLFWGGNATSAYRLQDAG